MDHVLGLDDPHMKAFLALVTQGQHVAGHMHQGVGREHQAIEAGLAIHIRRIGGSVHGCQVPGEVTALFIGIGGQLPYREQVPALTGPID